MWRLIGFGCAVGSLLLLGSPNTEKFSKYNSVETYEIRPGILAMPRYTSDGQVCEVTIERRHSSAGAIKLDSTLPRKTIIEIADELAPPEERGPSMSLPGAQYMSTYSGGTTTTSADYENVSVDIYGSSSRMCDKGDIVATISWKRRKCK